MVVKYTINDVVADDIRKRLLTHYCSEAGKIGLLLKAKDNNFEITTYSVKDLPNQISLKLSKPALINNVWYRLLNIGIWLWIRQVRIQKSGDNNLVLCLPFGVYKYKQKDIVLAETNSNRINILSAFFIRISVRTTTKDAAALNIEKIIGALFGQIEDALKDNNSRLFNSAKDNLVQFHKEIESSMFFINDDGKPDNWLLLSDGEWFGTSFLNVFIKESTSVARAVTRRIQDDANYYETWCHLYTRLYSAQKNDTPVREVAEVYIDGHYSIWRALMSWMGGFNPGDLGDLIASQQRDRAIKHFVGSWERWHHLINNNFRSVNENGYYCASRHLENTSCMLIQATKYDNFDAARWAADVLVYWYELFSNNQLYFDYHWHSWHHELITPSILRCSDDQPLLRAVLGNNKLMEPEATSIALRNYWTDIRCLTAAYLLGSNKYRVNESYKECIDALLACKRLEATGRDIRTNHAPLSNAKNILGVYLRQSDCWGDKHTYTKIIEQHLERLSMIEEPEWIPGRGYSSFGTKEELYLPVFCKVVGIGLTSAKFKPNTKWMSFLKSDAVSQRELESLITKLRDLISIDESITSLVCHQFDIEEAEFKRRADLFIESINEAIIELEANIASQIINAPLDLQRLENFGVSASGSTFTLSEGPMPILLFKDIEYIDDFNSDLVRTNIIDYQKSEVSQGLDVNRVANEYEWLNKTVARRATTVSFQQLFRQLSWKESEFNDNLSLISRAIDDSELIREEGYTPIMFVGPWNVYQLIDASKWRYGKEEDRLPFDISVESEKGNGYICHLAGIEVYASPFSKSDFSILFPIEAFKKINIKRFDKDRYVDVTFTTESETDLTGTLSLSFGIECEFYAEQCFKYLSLNPDE